MTVRYYSSQAVETTLSAPVLVGDVSISVNSVSGYPPNFPFTIVVDPDTGDEELMEVTATVGSTFTVTRGTSVDGSTAKAHATGAVVKHAVSARDFKNSRDHENASTNVHGLSAGVAVVGDTATQTLTNKTISGSSNTLTNIPTSAVVGTAVTQADTGTVTSTMILDGTILNADINASAAIAKTKIAGTAVTLADVGTVSDTMLNSGISPTKIAGTGVTIADFQELTNKTLGNNNNVKFGSTLTNYGTITGTGTINGTVLQHNGKTLPLAFSSGTETISISASTTGSVTVTFPGSRFTVAPVVTAVSNNSAYAISVTSLSSSGCTINARHIDGTSTTVTVTVYWMAIQQTSSAYSAGTAQ